MPKKKVKNNSKKEENIGYLLSDENLYLISKACGKIKKYVINDLNAINKDSDSESNRNMLIILLSHHMLKKELIEDVFKDKELYHFCDVFESLVENDYSH